MDQEPVKELVPIDPANVPVPLDRDTLPTYQEAQLVKNAKRTIPRMFKALNTLLEKGDRKALELAAEIYQYKKSGNNINIATNILRQNFNNGEQKGGKNVWFESIVQKIETEKNAAPNNAPDNIIDAEIVEPDK